MDIKLLDPKVDIKNQLDGGQSGPVMFIALFHVPESDAAGLLDAWYGEEAFLLEQPGFISRELVRGRSGSDVFMDVAKWESAGHYKAALIHPEHQALLSAYGPLGGSSALHLLDSTTKPLPPIVREFIDAVNRGDSRQAFALFDPKTGVIVDNGNRFVGHDEILPWNDQWFIGAGGKVAVAGVSVNGNTVTLTGEWKSAAYTGPTRCVFILDGSRIAELRLGQ